MKSASVIYRNVFVEDRLSDIEVRKGTITAIVPTGQISAEEHRIIEGNERLAIPALVDSHAHLDKTILGLGRYDHEYDHSLKGCIENEHRMRQKLGHDPYTQAKRYIELVVPLGTLFMRSHIDIDPVNRIRGAEGVLRACAEYRDRFSAETVAFPQSGLLSAPGTLEYMDEALAMGVDVVGGLDPSVFDGDAAASIAAIFRLAEKHDKPIDFHLHETGQVGIDDAQRIIDATKAYSWQGRVALSHAFCLADTANPRVQTLIEQLAEQRIHVVTSATSANAPKARPLLEAGINYCGGNDNMRDLWNPLGTGDILERIRYLAIANNFRRESEFHTALGMCSHNGAQLLGLKNYGLKTGCAADFVLVKASNLSEAAAILPQDRLVVRQGEVIAENGRLIAD